jgi:hypothetical protein
MSWIAPLQISPARNVLCRNNGAVKDQTSNKMREETDETIICAFVLQL